MCRFHNSADEISLNFDVVPPLSDDVQLTVDQYRSKLYEVRLNSPYSNGVVVLILHGIPYTHTLHRVIQPIILQRLID